MSAPRPLARPTLLTGGALVALLALSASAAAQERMAPAPGALLVSGMRIDAGPFHQSVVLLLTHDEEGTLGLIVNRRTGATLSEAIPGLDVGEASPTLYFGGPVGLEGLVVLFRSAEPPAGAEEVMPGVYYSGERAVLEELLGRGLPDDEMRLYIGHSGWAPGQLDAELREGAWHVQRADVFTLFRTEPEWMWETLTGGSRSIALLRTQRLR